MRTVSVSVYKFEELSESAKAYAIEKEREIYEYPWSDNWKQSIEAFCGHFGIVLKNWGVGPWNPTYYKLSDYDNSNFRGLKLSQFNRDHMPTGYYGDCTLWQTFYDEFKRTTDAKHAFEKAVRAGFYTWRADWEDSLEDEQISEFLTLNEYEFTEDGVIV